MPINAQRLRQHLNDFHFKTLFIEDLGWSQPSHRQPHTLEVAGVQYTLLEITELGGVAVYEIASPDGSIPSTQTRAAIHSRISPHENLLIFIDRERSQSLWYWVKRTGGKVEHRDHTYFSGQPGDLFISKLAPMIFELTDLDDQGNASVVQVAQALEKALDVAPVTKKFFTDFRTQKSSFHDHITGIGDEHDKQWYASVLLHRLMFIYFLQRKGFLDDGDREYLQTKLEQSRKEGPNLYYSEFLKTLFFEGFALPEESRTADTNTLLGKIKYLNGGLFLRHRIEIDWPDIAIQDAAFEELLTFLSDYSWNLDDTPGGNDDEINPDVLGYIFEKYINQKAFGAYYTRTEITEYLCEQTIHRLILDKVNTPAVPGVAHHKHFNSVPELLMSLDARLCRMLLHEVLPSLSLLDPACGSGAFLVAAMKTLIDVYTSVIGKIEFLHDPTLTSWLRDVRANHPSLPYFIRKSIITNNLFGVDLMEEATEIAKLRLFLALVSSVSTVEQLEPLPNIDFNILAGNSLIGLLRVDEAAYDKRYVQLDMFIQKKSYHELVTEKNTKVRAYRNATTLKEPVALQNLRDDIESSRKDAINNLNKLLLDEFNRLGIKFEQATWDAGKNAEGKPTRRNLTLADIEVLHPFHWGYEFSEVMNDHGGFDAIITNPPWDIFKPNAKEFFADYSNLVTKNKMTIKEFEEAQADLLKDSELRAAWLQYQSRFPYVSSFFRTAPQYRNQISEVNGKKAGTDINLYKLFTEQCYNLLRDKGEGDRGYCGIVIPSGIYTDLGTKQLRELLFGQSKVLGLFCFENRKEIFEGVHRSFKFVVLTFEKGGSTTSFPAAFMRHDVAELEHFPREGAIAISVELVRRLSPDSLSVMEFKSATDVQIAEKMLRFPLLGEKIEGRWNLKLTAEFHMTNDSKLFRSSPASGRLPLYEGKMIHQFTQEWAKPKIWIDEVDGRKALLGRNVDTGQCLDYQKYRFGLRAIARSTDVRTIIVGPIPQNVFCGNSILVASTKDAVARTDADRESLFVQALLNSFVVDSYIRQMVSANINMFYIKQLPVPRLTEAGPAFEPIVQHAARLICTTPEFDDLAREVGLTSHEDGAIDPIERARLRAELDGLVAHLYGLTEAEFAHILTTFPIVEHSVKDAALAAYRSLVPQPGDAKIAALIKSGEGPKLEFKSSLRWDIVQAKVNVDVQKAVLKTIVAFMNSDGGTLLIGVADDGNILGIEQDIASFSKHPNTDGFEQHLRSLLADTAGAQFSPYAEISFSPQNHRTVCVVHVKPSPKPVFLSGQNNSKEFYIRTGNLTRALNMEEYDEYKSLHWR